MYRICTKSNRLAYALVIVLASLFSRNAWALPPVDAQARAEIVGQPKSIEVYPGAIVLKGTWASEQILVTGHYADGRTRDLTAFASFESDNPAIAKVQPGGFVQPVGEGSCTVRVTVGGHSANLSVQTSQLQQEQPVSFRHHVIAALNVGGCNMGACHGTPSGKNGFKLSLRGFDPAADYVQLTRDVLGRRTSVHHPEESLLLAKGLGRVAHAGGMRFVNGSVPVNLLVAWHKQGMQNDSAQLPKLTKIEVAPGRRVYHAPARWQQLAVKAHFSDGSVRDVTRLTNFSSSDAAIAETSLEGLVEFRQAGEVAILCRYLDELQSVRLTYLEPREGFVWQEPPQHNFVDQHAFAQMKLMSIRPSELCTDSEFVRRVTLDVVGRLPTVAEVKAFLADPALDKRSKWIDRLLEMPEYADFWALKWADVLRNNRKTIQYKGAVALQRWLRGHFLANTPIDEIVRQLITASGQTFANPPANYYRITRDPQNLAESTAQLFMGVRMQCAKCHNHPFERWTQDDYYNLASFFARVRLRRDPDSAPPKQDRDFADIVYLDRGGEIHQPRTGRLVVPSFPGGIVAKIAPDQDRREVLAQWLVAADNPFFAKSVVNRVWYHLFGKGIVDPVDDFRDSNPACNEALLEALTADFVKHRFDLKHLIRTICNSRTYQLSAQTNEFNEQDGKYFSHAYTKLHSAEQLLDAISDVMELPERFAGVPAGTRAIQLPDGEINHPFLKTFGQPARELACECEREGEANLGQALQLINGPTINEKLRANNNRIGRLLGSKLSDEEILRELYLATLSREPVEAERRTMLEFVGRQPDRRRAWEDVHWTLMNTKEFLFRH
jgi:hypothetical protein